MENYESIFYEKIKAIEADSHRVLIVNAGSIYSGKTLVFNSLVDFGETFNVGYRKIADRIQIEKWYDNIFLIDTPVLPVKNANINTIHAYNQASVILYVHNIKHELKFDDIDSILKIVSDEKSFWSRFCLVLTNFDDFSKEYVEKIQHNILEQIQREFDVGKYPVFTVSNDKHSISKIKTWIDMHLPRLKYAKIKHSQELFDHIKEDITRQIIAEQNRIQSRIARTISQVTSQQNDFRRDVDDMYSEIQKLRR